MHLNYKSTLDRWELLDKENKMVYYGTLTDMMTIKNKLNIRKAVSKMIQKRINEIKESIDNNVEALKIHKEHKKQNEISITKISNLLKMLPKELHKGFGETIAELEEQNTTLDFEISQCIEYDKQQRCKLRDYTRLLNKWNELEGLHVVEGYSKVALMDDNVIEIDNEEEHINA